MAQDIFASSPEIDLRKRWALMQLQNSTDMSPVGHPLAAVARALQGAIGGYTAGQAEAEDKAAGAAMFNSLPGIGAPQGMATPQAPQAAPAASPDMSMPRGFRNNNPLNIEAGGFTQGQPGFSGSDGRFAKFGSMDDGLAAANKLLDTYQNKYGLNTVGGIVNRWAPPTENDSRGYAASVAGRLGISPDQPLTPDQRPALIGAMAQFENGRPLPPAGQAPFRVAQAGGGLPPVPGGPGAPTMPGMPGAAPPQATPQVAAPAGMYAPNRSSVQIPPDVQETIKRLGADQRTRPYALQLYSQYAKPVEQYAQGVDTNGVPFQRNTVTGEVKADPRREAAITEAEYARNNWQKLGFPDPASKDANSQKFWQDYNAKRLGGPGTNVTVDQRGENEFSKEAGKLTAKRYADIADDVPQAKQMLSDVRTLQELGKVIGTGKEAQIKASLGPYAQMFGIDIKNMGEIQAFDSIVQRVAPNLRVKGSGSQSDFELRNFLKSLPSLGNTEEGNAIASHVMTGLYENKVKAAEIASAAMNGEISRKDADKQLRELPDPMEAYREHVKKNPDKTVVPNAVGGFDLQDPASRRKAVDSLIEKYK